MALTDDSAEKENVYFNDPESGAEMARLIEQDRLVTAGMGGLFSERANLDGIHSVLDVACGPGGWVQEVAFKYPDIKVVGIDISRAMVEYAQAQAQVQSLKNASFFVMDIQKPLDFPDNSFDLVNARFINFLPAAAWKPLMREFHRITRPGGTVRLTESEWWYFTNSPALEKINAMIISALKKQGGSFSESGRFTGVLPMLGRFLQEAGCTNIEYKAHAIDFSFGTDAYEGFRLDATLAFKLFQPFVVKMGVTTKEDVERTYEQMKLEMWQEDFRGMMLPLTAWGERV